MAEEFIRHLLLQVFFSLFYAPDKDLYPHEVVVTEDLATGLTVNKLLWTTFSLQDYTICKTYLFLIQVRNLLLNNVASDPPPFLREGLHFAANTKQTCDLNL